MKYTNRDGLPEAFVKAIVRKHESRFWRKVAKCGPTDCWTWTATRDSDGYGHFYCFGKITKAHRASYLMFRGAIPSGNVVMHSCDNPSCVNPAHLSVGSQLENVRDCSTKGRRANLKGEAHGRSFLDVETVKAIRNAVMSGVRQIDMARGFGIRKGLVCDIVSRRTWRHI